MPTRRAELDHVGAYNLIDANRAAEQSRSARANLAAKQVTAQETKESQTPRNVDPSKGTTLDFDG